MSGHGKGNNEVAQNGYESVENNQIQHAQAGAEDAARHEVFAQPGSAVGDTNGLRSGDLTNFTRADLDKLSDKELLALAKALDTKLNQAFCQCTPKFQDALSSGHMANMAQDAPELFATVKTFSDMPQYQVALADVEKQTPAGITRTINSLGEAAEGRNFQV
jgi:hypothetical protein